MKNRYFSLNMQANVARDRHDLANALEYSLQSEEASRYYTRFNPADAGGWDNRATGLLDIAGNYFDLGRITEARKTLEEGAALEKDPRNKTETSFFTFEAWAQTTLLNAQLGNLGSARAALEQSHRTLREFVKDRSIDAELQEISGLSEGLLECSIDQAEGSYAKVHAKAVETADKLARMKLQSEGNVEFRANALRQSRNLQVESALRLGNFEEAVQVSRDQLDNSYFSRRMDALEVAAATAVNRVRYGQALLGAGRRTEALAALHEAEDFYRQQLAQGATDTDFRLKFTRTLYHLARAQADDAEGRTRRLALLDEAIGQLGALSIEAQQLRDSRELIKWVTEARREARVGE